MGYGQEGCLNSRDGRADAQRRRWFTGISAIVLFVILTGCPGPGEGRKAEAAFARAQPIIDALARCNEVRGEYPDRLDALVPDYLPESTLELRSEYPFEYRRTEESYELSFRYVGPGMNECVFAPERERWDCSGYF